MYKRQVYGGSKNGLMGALAESVLRAGGKVTGVEPQFFIDEGYQYDEITTLIVTRDMTERKTKMIELGDAFIEMCIRDSSIADCGEKRHQSRLASPQPNVAKRI